MRLVNSSSWTPSQEGALALSSQRNTSGSADPTLRGSEPQAAGTLAEMPVPTPGCPCVPFSSQSRTEKRQGITRNLAFS